MWFTLHSIHSGVIFLMFFISKISCPALITISFDHETYFLSETIRKQLVLCITTFVKILYQLIPSVNRFMSVGKLTPWPVLNVFLILFLYSNLMIHFTSFCCLCNDKPFLLIN